jgi:hypothetical protein
MTTWKPSFTWVSTPEECSFLINEPHEDNLIKCDVTQEMIEYYCDYFATVNNSMLLAIQNEIGKPASHSGFFRRLEVKVGNHTPPQPWQIESLMNQLAVDQSNIVSIEQLLQWYYDFESIHPFEDYNGRVGGVIVAVISHRLFPNLGYLAPVMDGDVSIEYVDTYLINSH